VNQQDYDRQRRANLALAQTTCAQRAQLAALADDVGVTSDGIMVGETGTMRSSFGAMMGADTTGLGVTATLRMRQIPTSFVHLLDEQTTPLITFELRNQGDRKRRIKLTTRVEKFSAAAVDTIELDRGGSQTVSQLPVFLLERVQAVREARTACVTVRVDDLDGRTEQEQTYRVVLLPRTTAYLSVPDGAGGVHDLTRYLGAWVTPNAPEILQLVREAAARAPGGNIVGYQAASLETMPAVVDAQVEAIYGALQACKLTYVNSINAFNLEGGTFAQRIRLPREALAMGSANCIDGVVLMASVLEAASLDPAIVVIPGHAFLAYEQIAHSGRWAYVETTLLGSASFAEARRAGEATASAFASRPSSRLVRLPIARLRVEHGVFPME